MIMLIRSWGLVYTLVFHTCFGAREIVDFAGPAGPGWPETPSDRRAAKQPAGWAGGRLDPQNHMFWALIARHHTAPKTQSTHERVL
jgi:hypothetical protein